MKKCCRCKAEKEDAQFHKFTRKNKKGTYLDLSYQCKKCDSLRGKIYREKNKEKEKIRSNKKNKAYRLLILNKYSNNDIKCECCGEREVSFMALDHINGGGGKDRKKHKNGGNNFYMYLIKNNFPTGFQVLCHNCNMAKGFYGKCPHQK